MKTVLAIAVVVLLGGAACSGDDGDTAPTQPEQDSASTSTTDSVGEEPPEEESSATDLDGTWDVTIGKSAKRLMTLTCDTDSCTGELVLPTGDTFDSGELARDGNTITSSGEDTCGNVLVEEWTLVGDELVGTSQASVEAEGECKVGTSDGVAVRYDGSVDEWLEDHGI